jgi:hypothetical protein
MGGNPTRTYTNEEGVNIHFYFDKSTDETEIISSYKKALPPSRGIYKEIYAKLAIISTEDW